MCILDCLLVSVTIFYTNKAKIWMGVVTSLHAARSLALSTSDGALVRIRFFWFAATGPFQAFWMCCVCWEGFGELARPDHNVSVDATDWLPCIQMLSGSMDCLWSSSVDAAAFVLYHCWRVYIDACASDNGVCSVFANCSNTVGGFNCTCHDGFTGDGYNCTSGKFNQSINQSIY